MTASIGYADRDSPFSAAEGANMTRPAQLAVAWAAVLAASIMIVGGSAAIAAEKDRDALPGRRIKVAAIAIGFGGEHDAKLKLALDHLETAGENGVDVACLPEEFAGTTAEPIPGPTTTAVAELAARHRMYVICPIREQDGREQYNTAVLIDREGKVAGQYRKVFVYWGEGLLPSREGVKAFETDFGRIGILTCFDLNFAELWHQADLLDVDVVFWPSAYAGGSPLNAYAMLHHYYVVPVGLGNIIDVTGRTLADVQKPRPQQFIATLDLDRTFIHTNFNSEKVPKLLEEHPGEVELEHYYDAESWWLLRSTKPGVRVRDLCREHQIETLREYRHRSRRQIDEARRAGEKV
jgi:predicted amidohydrolase